MTKTAFVWTKIYFDLFEKRELLVPYLANTILSIRLHFGYLKAQIASVGLVFSVTKM